MSITIIKEGNSIRILQSDSDLPEGEPITLFTQAEFSARVSKEWLNAQIPAFIRGDEDEDAEELF